MKKILIVDDSHEVRTLLKFYLEDYGFDLHLASSGESAIELISSIKFDLVISDLEMPNGGGEWLLEKLAVLPLPPAVIILSGKVGVSEKQLIQKGARAFFQKPVVLPSLVKYVLNLFEEAKPTS